MDPNSQEYMDLYSYVTSLTPAAYKGMKKWEAKRIETEKKMASANPCGGNPCAANPCAAKNPCGGNPCAAKNPCGGNPCAAKNPCKKW